jgi:cell cycle sensor histidine kinase DivJ
VWNYVNALVHPAAKQDALTAARHRAFIAPRLVGSFVALASFPVYIAFRGVPSVLEVAVFGWLVAPILIAYFLSRTGRYESAHILSSLSLTGMVTAVALCNGGIGSFAAIWLVVVPLEAALSASRRVVALTSIFALAAAGLLLVLSAADFLPPPTSLANGHGALAALGIVSAALYATGLALGAWGAVQATAAGLAMALGGVIRDAVATMPGSGPASGYQIAYGLEVAMLLTTVLTMMPLLRNTRATA